MNAPLSNQVALISAKSNGLEYQALQLALDFLERYSNESTKKRYLNILKRYFQKLTINNIEDFKNFSFHDLVRETTKFIMSQKSDSSIRVAFSAINGFYKWLSSVYGTKNPVQKPILPKKRSKSNTKSLEFHKVKKLIKKLGDYSALGYKEHLTYCLALVLATTSLRISEVLQITVQMVKDGILVIVQKRGAQREIELPQEVQTILLAFIDKFSFEGSLFKTKKGKKLSRNYAYKLVKGECGISPHGFRKTVIETLVERNEHPHEIAKVTGHTNINMVHYYDNRDTKPQAHKALSKDLLQN